MTSVLAVAAGGAIGSVGRWGLGMLLSSWLPGLPAGTFVANVLAGLIIGVVSGAGSVTPLPEETRLLLTVGLCGGLSTFSTRRCPRRRACFSRSGSAAASPRSPRSRTRPSG